MGSFVGYTHMELEVSEWLVIGPVNEVLEAVNCNTLILNIH